MHHLMTSLIAQDMRRPSHLVGHPLPREIIYGGFENPMGLFGLVEVVWATSWLGWIAASE